MFNYILTSFGSFIWKTYPKYPFVPTVVPQIRFKLLQARQPLITVRIHSYFVPVIGTKCNRGTRERYDRRDGRYRQSDRWTRHQWKIREDQELDQVFATARSTKRMTTSSILPKSLSFPQNLPTQGFFIPRRYVLQKLTHSSMTTIIPKEVLKRFFSMFFSLVSREDCPQFQGQQPWKEKNSIFNYLFILCISNLKKCIIKESFWK